EEGVGLLLGALFVQDGEQAGTIHSNGRSGTALDVLHVHELDDTVVTRFDGRALANARRRSADVERTHGELGAGFADGLRGDDTDGFAQFHHAARSEVAAVAQRANSTARFASENGTDANALDIRCQHRVGQIFAVFLVS